MILFLNLKTFFRVLPDIESYHIPTLTNPTTLNPAPLRYLLKSSYNPYPVQQFWETDRRSPLLLVHRWHFSEGSHNTHRNMIPHPPFLPMSMKEAARLGISQFDIILVNGDAYVDHPSFGTALIGRVLWDKGYTVGIIAQPDWKSDRDFTVLGAPRLFFGVSSGSVDSMVNNFTPNLKRRKKDVYSPGGIPRRPDRATIVYADRLHALYPGIPIVIGGIEASLRRFAHYDYWQDRIRQSILADAPADLLVFGMGERQVCDIARRLDAGEPANKIRDIPGTACKMDLAEWRASHRVGIVAIPSFSEVSRDKTAYARAFALHYSEQDPVRGRPVAQPHQKTVIVQNPPARPLTTPELDHVYELPFSRRAHPSYRQPVPALEPVQFSVTSHRGCFGACSFCALTHHQGRIVQSRSIGSIVREVERMAKMPEFRGTVQDVGGPTANMYGLACRQWAASGACPDRHCTPACPNLSTDHGRQVELLQRLREIPGVRHVFVSSGVRYDLIPAGDDAYLTELCGYHVSGHLKVAPEHIVEAVTACMNKPGVETFDAFRARFEPLQEGKHKRQYLLPYFMSGHPGCTVADMIELAEYIRDNNLYTEQVQDFTPTPMSVATCMYYTGLDPFTMQPVHVPRGREKRIQRAMLQYRDPKNRKLVTEGLRAAGREDLITTFQLG
jgi:uncharacterized radical SAM protein YgiQ